MDLTTRKPWSWEVEASRKRRERETCAAAGAHRWSDWHRDATRKRRVRRACACGAWESKPCPQPYRAGEACQLCDREHLPPDHPALAWKENREHLKSYPAGTPRA